jgi:hypothetical protein
MGPLSRAPALAVLIAAVSACGDPAPDEPPPVLSQPMIDLGHVVEFLPFGATLSGSGALNPAYELRTDVDTVQVVAVSAGVVVAIRANDQGDSEIEIRPTRDSIYAVIYDHVREAAVGVGTSVQPGTVLGRIGSWSAPQGRTELQINRDGNPTLAHCPAQFGTAEFNTAHVDAMNRTPSPSPSVCLRDSVVP